MNKLKNGILLRCADEFVPGFKGLTTEKDAYLLFIEKLLVEDEADEKIRRRWQQVAKDPLALQRRIARARWRGTRKAAGKPLLASRPVFRAAESANFILTEESPGGHAAAATRAHLYHSCLAALEDIVRNRGLLDKNAGLPPAAFKQLTSEMTSATGVIGWPHGTPAPMEFAIQLTRDGLYFAYGFQASTALSRQLMEGLGEHRFPGNAWTPANVADALAAAKTALGLP